MLARIRHLRDNVRMLQKTRPRHFLKQWREHAGLSLTAVKEKAEALFADRIVAEGEEVDLGKIGLSHSTLSRIENFKLPFTEYLLDVLAEVYGTDRVSLQIRDPSDPEGIWTIYDKVPPTERPAALRMLKGLASDTGQSDRDKTGTDG